MSSAWSKNPDRWKDKASDYTPGPGEDGKGFRGGGVDRGRSRSTAAIVASRNAASD